MSFPNFEETEVGEFIYKSWHGDFSEVWESSTLLLPSICFAADLVSDLSKICDRIEGSGIEPISSKIPMKSE